MILECKIFEKGSKPHPDTKKKEESYRTFFFKITGTLYNSPQDINTIQNICASGAHTKNIFKFCQPD